MIVALGLLVTVPLVPGEAVAAGQGWFSPEQVERGKGLYEKRCQHCHGDEKLEEFSTWPNSAKDLIATIRSFSMPADRPGGLPAQEYVDIVAYFFSSSGLPHGEEVVADSPDLAKIKLP